MIILLRLLRGCPAHQMAAGKHADAWRARPQCGDLGSKLEFVSDHHEQTIGVARGEGAAFRRRSGAHQQGPRVAPRFRLAADVLQIEMLAGEIERRCI